MTAKYTPAKVVKWIEAHKALAAASIEEFADMRDALTQCEIALIEEGWQNFETEEEMATIAAEDIDSDLVLVNYPE